jgi:pimeloyl-ACP methyl ester carboxylesterase
MWDFPADAKERTMSRNTCFCVACVLLIASPLARAEGPANPLDGAPSRYAKSDGMKVHYKSLGKGDTALVLVHGWTADMTSWRYQVPAFDGKVRLVLIDLPGHGRSDKPKIDYTMDVFARAIDAVLTDAGVKKAALAGHSMGTPVVRQFYRRYPKKVVALIAVDGALQKFDLPPELRKKIVAQIEGPNFKASMGKLIASMFTKDTPREVRKHLMESYPAAPQHVAVSAMKAMQDPSIWKDDPIKVPAQTIVAKGPFWTAEYEKYVRKLAPGIGYQKMDGVGHFLMMEKPREFNALMLAFLKKNGVVK